MFEATDQPWLEQLDSGDYEAAWDLFLRAHRRSIERVARRCSNDVDTAMDIFAACCDKLHADGMSRIRRFVLETGAQNGCRFSTWLTVVVRNVSVDLVRQREGRRRFAGDETLDQKDRATVRAVRFGSMSFAEAYGSLDSQGAIAESYPRFLRRLRRLMPRLGNGLPVRPRPVELDPRLLDDGRRNDVLRSVDGDSLIREALDQLKPEDALAVQMFVVDGCSAEEVARTLRWRNRKTVYNRVARALATMRKYLDSRGLEKVDLL